MIFIGIVDHTFGQEFKQITGSVTDSENTPIQGATIILSGGNNNIIQYGKSSSNGSFKLVFREEGNFTISIQSIGYESQKHSFYTDKETSLVKNFVLNLQVEALDEVIVEHIDVEPDSVFIEMENMGLNENSSLHDILSKNPAFSVGDDGAILYKGKNIDKININNKPAFINQNKMALESLEKRLIEDISIRNNLKNRFTLGFEDQGETLLNINTKEEMKNIAIAEVEAAYGLSKKYEGKGQSLHFSTPANVFFTHSSNNFGSYNLEARDVRMMFNHQDTYSEIEKDLINKLFDNNIARFKDVRSTTTATIRHEKERYQIHSVTYHMSNDRATAQNVNSITPNGESILSQDNTNMDRFNSIFNKSSIDWAASKNMVLGYNVNLNIIWQQDNRNSLVDLQQNTNPLIHELSSKGRLKNVRIDQQIYHKHRIKDKVLINSDLKYEQLSVEDNRGIFQKEEKTMFRQYELTTSNLKASSKIQYRHNTYLIPSLDYQIGFSSQNTEQRDSSTSYQRNMLWQEFTASASGEKLFKYLKYNASFNLSIYSLKKTTRLFIPYSLNVNYEKLKYRWYGSIKRRYYINDISFSVDRIDNYMDVFSGNQELIDDVNFQDNIQIGYSYNNLFAGKSWGVIFNLDKNHNSLGQSFSSVDGGIRYFDTRAISNIQTATAIVDGSIRILPSFYPMTLSAGFGYQQTQNTAFQAHREFSMLQHGPKGNFGLMSLSPSWFNFEIKSDIKLFTVSSLDHTFDSQSIKNSFEVITRTGNVEGRVTFLHWIDRLYGRTYKRRNIDLRFEYHKRKYSWGIRGRNIDDFLPMFDNMAFNNYIDINQGVNTVIRNSQAMRYLLVFFKYKFNR